MKANDPVSEEEAHVLFDRAFESGLVVLSDYYKQYRPLKEELRAVPIQVSDSIKGDIPDYESFRKSAFGTLKPINTGGVSVERL